jgi:hypothetical protein
MKSTSVVEGSAGHNGKLCQNEGLVVRGGFEFHIISLDNKQWIFELNSMEERDEWVSAIEQQILISLGVNKFSQTFEGMLLSSSHFYRAINPTRAKNLVTAWLSFKQLRA